MMLETIQAYVRLFSHEGQKRSPEGLLLTYLVPSKKESSHWLLQQVVFVVNKQKQKKYYISMSPWKKEYKKKKIIISIYSKVIIQPLWYM
jgi:hypothetical protein